jgi:hypothetical protein
MEPCEGIVVPKKLFVAWQDPASRRWFPVGLLTQQNDGFCFRYIQGVLEAKNLSNFQGLQSFPDLQRAYYSGALFPVFQNRVLSVGRPEYNDFVRWLNLPEDTLDPVAILARTGGKKETDTLEVFPCPEPTDGDNFSIQFFGHGIRHINGAPEKVRELQSGEELLIVHESTNKFDSLALRLDRDTQAIAYCPRYLNPDIHKLRKLEDVRATVERVNQEPVPIQFRLLCRIEARWPQGFEPFDYPEYKPIVEEPITKSTSFAATR